MCKCTNNFQYNIHFTLFTKSRKKKNILFSKVTDVLHTTLLLYQHQQGQSVLKCLFLGLPKISSLGMLRWWWSSSRCPGHHKRSIITFGNIPDWEPFIFMCTTQQHEDYELFLLSNYNIMSYFAQIYQKSLISKLH